MTTPRKGWWIIGGLFVIAALALGWQRYRSLSLQLELQVLQEETRELAQLQAENQRLARDRIAAADVQKLRTEQADLQRLRVEVEKLRADAAKPKAEVSDPAQAPPPKNEMKLVDTLRNAGRGTPRAAGETFVWALQRGDVDLAASLLAFTPEARAKMEAILKTVPATVRNDYDTPEKLMAFVMAGSPGIAGYRVLSESEDDDANRVTQRLEILSHGGTQRRQDSVRFERGPDGWRRLIQPPTVEKLGNFVQERRPEKG